MRSINNPTAIPPTAASILPDGGPTVRRAITANVPGERNNRVLRIATSSEAGVILRHPGMRSTLHAGAALPHP